MSADHYGGSRRRLPQPAHQRRGLAHGIGLEGWALVDGKGELGGEGRHGLETPQVGAGHDPGGFQGSEHINEVVGLAQALDIEGSSSVVAGPAFLRPRSAVANKKDPHGSMMPRTGLAAPGVGPLPPFQMADLYTMRRQQRAQSHFGGVEGRASG